MCGGRKEGGAECQKSAQVFGVVEHGRPFDQQRALFPDSIFATINYGSAPVSALFSRECLCSEPHCVMSPHRNVENTIRARVNSGIWYRVPKFIPAPGPAAPSPSCP